MKCKALKGFLHDELGRVEKGAEFDATAAQLGGVKAFVEVYETKVDIQQPAIKSKPSKKAT
jgi:hypothetical protein